MKRATYYDILGLDRNAGTEEIKKSFHALSLRYHPDTNPADSNAHSEFIIISSAYHVLIDDAARRGYDAYLGKREHTVYAAPRYVKECDPLVLNELSEMNYLFWDLDDLLKKVSDDNLETEIDGRRLYDYVLRLLQFLEEGMLRENYRFAGFSGKRNRIKLHLENYYHLLRVEIDNRIKNMDKKSFEDPGTVENLMRMKNGLIRGIGEIGRYV